MSILPVPVQVSRLLDRGVDGAMARMAIRDAIKTSPKRVPNRPAASLTMQTSGHVGKSDAKLYRNLSTYSEWVRAAIDIRRDQVANAEWIVEAADSTKRNPNVRTIEQITERLLYPNPIDDDWVPFITRIVEDLLVLDAGVVEKERTLGGGIAGLWPVDAAEIRVSRWWDGDPDEARYFWYPDHQNRASFVNDDLMYMMSNPMTYRVVGLAPLETLKMVVDAELAGQDYNTRQIKSPAPDGILDLGEQARPEMVDKFKAYWQAEVAGRGAMAFLGGSKNSKFMPFRTGNREMQFLEFQMYLARKIAIVFGMSLQDLGVPLDSNRATATVTSQNTDDRGLRPLLGLVASYINRSVVHDRSYGGRNNNIAFKFTALNLKESETQSKINEKALAGMPWKMVDEARKDDGRPPLGGVFGKSLIALTPKGPIVIPTDEDLPTAREHMEAAKPKPPVGAPPPA